MQELCHLEQQKNREGNVSWMKIVDFLLNYTKFDTGDIENNEKYQNTNMFLRDFLCEYKRNFKFESYLDNLNYDDRKDITKFKLCNHNLPVERLRYENVR